MTELTLSNGWMLIKTIDGFEQISTANKKVKTKECLSNGLYPVIDQGQDMIAGFINDNSKLIKVTQPLCLFGDHTRIIKWIIKDFAPGADGTKILKAKKFLIPKFAYYQLKSLELPDKGYSRHFKFLKEISFKIPPLNEQQRIANKLDQLLAQVDSIKSRIDNIPKILKRFRQSVLNAAVTGKLTEKWHGKKSQWKTTLLKNIADIIDPHPSHRTPKVVKNGIPYIGIGDIKNDSTINFIDARKVSLDILKEHNKRYKLKKGDFIFGKIGTIGKATVLPIGIDYTLSANIILIQPKLIHVVASYLMFYLSSPVAMSEINKQANSTSQSAFGIKKMRAFEFDLPPIEEQTEIVKQVESLFAFADQVEQRVKVAQARINNLTQSILAKAFRGELVPQDPNDEPASELLKRIQQERQQATALAKAVKKNPLKTKKKQHYVPQSYLKRFTIKNEKSLIWKFDKKKNEYNQTPASVKKICTEDYLYYIPDGDGFDHVTLEDKISEIEKIGNDIIIKIINDVNTNKPYVRISEEEKGYFAFYIGLMLTRGPAFRDPINNMHVQLARNTLNTLYQNGKLTEPPPEVKKAITEKGINGVIKTLVYSFVSIEPMLKHAEDNAISILEKNWYFLVAPDDLEFITSDTPVCCISSSEKIINLEPAHPDAALFFPISKKITLIIQGLCNPNNMLIYMREAKSIEIINQLIANEANEFIFCSTKYDWLADIITNKTGRKLKNLTGNCDDGVIRNPYKKKQNNPEKHDKTTV
jgi:type I restriction enzyme S subunit